MELWVHVRPRSAREAVGGQHDGALRVRVTAPPAEGRANAAVCKAIARAFGVPGSAVRLVSGGRGRRKRLQIDGDPAGLEARRRELEGPAPAESEV
jgi:uncharacterized protein (TIGR00251 family)